MPLELCPLYFVVFCDKIFLSEDVRERSIDKSITRKASGTDCYRISGVGIKPVSAAENKNIS